MLYLQVLQIVDVFDITSQNDNHLNQVNFPK
jgi:hypothetical protein